MRRENHVIAYCRNANYDIALSKTLTEVVSRAQRNIRSKLIDQERDVGTGATKERVHSCPSSVFTRETNLDFIVYVALQHAAA